MSATLNAAAAIQAAKVSPWVARSSDHVFYRVTAVAVLAAVFFGFATTYYLKGLFGTPALPAVFHVHAIIFTAWIVLFNIQTALVASSRTDLHMRLGIIGASLAVAMVVLGILAAIAAAKLGHGDGELTHDPIEALVVNLMSLFVFLVFLLPALHFRRKPDAHKRLMVLATTAGLLPAAVGRWPVFGGKPAGAVAVVLVFVLAGPLYDFFSRRRVHPVYLWGLFFYALVSPPIRLILSRTEPIHRVAAWLMR